MGIPDHTKPGDDGWQAQIEIVGWIIGLKKHVHLHVTYTHMQCETPVR